MKQKFYIIISSLIKSLFRHAYIDNAINDTNSYKMQYHVGNTIVNYILYVKQGSKIPQLNITEFNKLHNHISNNSCVAENN